MANSLNISFFRNVTLVAARSVTAISLLLIPNVGRAQNPNCIPNGKDFWLMFLNNNLNQTDVEYSLTAVGIRGTTIHIENPTTQWDTIVSTTSAGSVRIIIPVESAFTEWSVVSGGGIHVTSDNPITLYASNYMSGSYDIATVFPTAILGTHYLTQIYREDNTGPDEVGIVAVEDSTELSLLYPTGNTFNVSLMRGQSYQMMDYIGLSCIEITSNGKPFAIFQGGASATVGNCGYPDHLYEQSYPMEFWGNHFLLVSTATRTSGDLVQITTLEDNCSIFLDESLVTTINSGGFHYYNLPSDTAVFLRTTKPVFVCMYLKGMACGNSNGDPSSVIIPPMEQSVPSSLFQAINTDNITEHFVNIVTPVSSVSSMSLDGDSIASFFSIANTDYAYTRLSIEPGTHILSCDSGNFVAWFYGLGSRESYAYVIGASLVNYTKNLYIDGHNTSIDSVSLSYCQGTHVPVWVEGLEDGEYVDWLIDTVWWASNLGSDLLNIDTGDHIVQAVIHPCDTLSAMVHVNPRVFKSVTDTSCFDQSYAWRGRALDSTGIYYDTVANAEGCDTIFSLDLFVVSRPEVAILQDVDCHEGTYSLSADLMGLQGYTFSWSSSPHDTMLDGHEHDATVDVSPRHTANYYLDVDYECPFREQVTLNPVLSAGADWLILPEYLTYDHPWLDVFDRSRNVIDRQWLVNQLLQGTSGSHLHYVTSDTDSIEVMLVINSTTCPDTLRSTIPFSHAAHWAPNVFTPDLGSSDLFTVVLNEGVAEDLYIYNRNGQLICHFEGPEPMWDGTRDGVACPQGTYVWKLRYHTIYLPDHHLTLTGTVTLIR